MSQSQGPTDASVGAPTSLTTEQQRLLEERYGPAHRTPVTLIIALVALGLLFVGWVIWAAYLQADQSVRWQTVGYSNVSQSSITVEFDVFKPADRSVDCVVRALDLAGTEVGRANVPITSPLGDVNVVYALSVTARPNTGEVYTCQLDQ